MTAIIIVSMSVSSMNSEHKQPTHHHEIQNMWHFFRPKIILSIGGYIEFPISRASDYFHL